MVVATRVMPCAGGACPVSAGHEGLAVSTVLITVSSCQVHTPDETAGERGEESRIGELGLW